MIEIYTTLGELLDRKTLEAVEKLPAEELKSAVLGILRNGEHLATLPIALGVQQPLEQAIREYVSSL